MGEKSPDFEKYIDGQFSGSFTPEKDRKDPKEYDRATQRLRDRKRKGPDRRIDIPEAR